jgi:hypothetical protein
VDVADTAGMFNTPLFFVSLPAMDPVSKASAFFFLNVAVHKMCSLFF